MAEAAQRDLVSRIAIVRTIVLIGAVIGAIFVFRALYVDLAAHLGVQSARFGVDLAPLWAATPVVKAHMAAALLAFFVGLSIFAQRKGSRLHRVLGWTWAVLIFFAAAISFVIRSDGRLSWIHGLSTLILVMLPIGLAFARMHKRRVHGGFMVSMFVLGMLIAGLFTFLPGRLMWRLVMAG